LGGACSNETASPLRLLGFGFWKRRRVAVRSRPAVGVELGSTLTLSPRRTRLSTLTGDIQVRPSEAVRDRDWRKRSAELIVEVFEW